MDQVIKTKDLKKTSKRSNIFKNRLARDEEIKYNSKLYDANEKDQDSSNFQQFIDIERHIMILEPKSINPRASSFQGIPSLCNPIPPSYATNKQLKPVEVECTNLRNTTYSEESFCKFFRRDRNNQTPLAQSCPSAWSFSNLRKLRLSSIDTDANVDRIEKRSKYFDRRFSFDLSLFKKNAPIRSSGDARENEDENLPKYSENCLHRAHKMGITSNIIERQRFGTGNILNRIGYVCEENKNKMNKVNSRMLNDEIWDEESDLTFLSSFEREKLKRSTQASTKEVSTIYKPRSASFSVMRSYTEIDTTFKQKKERRPAQSEDSDFIFLSWSERQTLNRSIIEVNIDAGVEDEKQGGSSMSDEKNKTKNDEIRCNSFSNDSCCSLHHRDQFVKDPEGNCYNHDHIDVSGSSLSHFNILIQAEELNFCSNHDLNGENSTSNLYYKDMSPYDFSPDIVKKCQCEIIGSIFSDDEQQKVESTLSSYEENEDEMELERYIFEYERDTCPMKKTKTKWNLKDTFLSMKEIHEMELELNLILN